MKIYIWKPHTVNSGSDDPFQLDIPNTKTGRILTKVCIPLVTVLTPKWQDNLKWVLIKIHGNFRMGAGEPSGISSLCKSGVFRYRISAEFSNFLFTCTPKIFVRGWKRYVLKRLECYKEMRIKSLTNYNEC